MRNDQVEYLAPIITVLSECNPLSRSAASVYSGNATWPTANKAIYFPWPIPARFTFDRFMFIVTTQNGNMDMGIYDKFGNLLTSTGSTAVPAAGYNELSLASPVILLPEWYYLGMACDGTTVQFTRSNFNPAVHGAREELSAFPLPATADLSTAATSTFNPLIGIKQVGCTL